MPKQRKAPVAHATDQPRENGSVWLRAAPPDIQQMILEARVRDELSRLSDDTAVPPELAALFLGVSESTLRRMRDGTGPKYVQPKSTSKGSEGLGRNQAIMYRIGELKAWQKNNQFSSTIEAAQARGLCFASLLDLATEQPFLTRVDKSQRVIGHGLAVPLTKTRRLLQGAKARILWMAWEEALALTWESSAARGPFERAFSSALSRAEGSSFAGREATEVVEATASKRRPSSRPTRPRATPL
jgi:hypothetical protein